MPQAGVAAKELSVFLNFKLNQYRHFDRVLSLCRDMFLRGFCVPGIIEPELLVDMRKS